jgi:hypothetical protein
MPPSPADKCRPAQLTGATSLGAGSQVVQLADGRPYTLVTSPLRPKEEGILAAEAQRLISILEELGAPNHPCQY